MVSTPQSPFSDRRSRRAIVCFSRRCRARIEHDKALEWAVTYPDHVVAAIPIATTARHSPQQIAFNEVGRQAIMADPDWRGGEYQLHDTRPSKGLAVARMAAHITYVSEMALQRKFGRSLQNREALSFQFVPDFQIESYLHHQGATFVDRFDANSYLYITRAMDYFDLAEEHGGRLSDVFRLNSVRFCIIAFTSGNTGTGFFGIHVKYFSISLWTAK